MSEQLEEDKARKVKWDNRFLELAKFISQWSRDPSTRVGAVITDNNNHIVSVGYNGFPKDVIDSDERYKDRDIKLSLTVHGELNAILFSKQQDLTKCTLYTFPFASCSRCAGAVIQSGIKRCVAPKLNPDSDLHKRWAESLNLTRQMFQEAGVILEEIEL